MVDTRSDAQEYLMPDANIIQVLFYLKRIPLNF